MKPNADAENYSCDKQLVNLETLLEVNQLPDVNIAEPVGSGICRRITSHVLPW